MKVNKNTQEILPGALPSTLHTNDSGRAEYERLDNGGRATIRCENGENKTVDTDIDYRDIVPYNPYLINEA